MNSASQVVNNVINCLTSMTGLVSAAIVVGVLQPVLLAVLLIAQVPGAWAAVRAARIRVPDAVRADRQLPAQVDTRPT